MRYRTYAAAIVSAAVFVGTADASPADRDSTPLTCDGKSAKFHVDRAMRVLDRAFSFRRYPDSTPAREKEKEAWQRHRRCLLDDGRKQRISRYRDKMTARYDAEWHRRTYTPYPGPGGSWWAIPAYIVACESGYDYTPAFGLTFGGAYGILVSTWHSYGGGAWASQANYAPPWAQDIIASRVWHDVGPQAWACA